MVTSLAGEGDTPEATQLWDSVQVCSCRYEKPCCCCGRDMGTGWTQKTQVTQQQLCPHNLAKTCLRLQSQSNTSADCDCYHHRGTRALCSNIHCRGCLRLTFTICSSLHLLHNECIQL